MRKHIVKAVSSVMLGLALCAGSAAVQAETQEEIKQETTEETADPEEEGTQAQEEDGPAIPDVPINIMALKGPTAMGMAWMMDQADSGSIDAPWNFSIISAVDEAAPALVKKEADIAALPANLASVLYNNTEGEIQVMAVNTLGVLYIVENGAEAEAGTENEEDLRAAGEETEAESMISSEEDKENRQPEDAEAESEAEEGDGEDDDKEQAGQKINSVEDLRGKTIYASGKGATPEYALNYILSANGIDPGSDVTIEWKSEHAECLAALLADEEGVALLPQPFVTTAQMKNSQVRVSLDLTEEWDRLQEGAKKPSALLTGVVAVRREFAEANPDAVAAFLDMYEKSTAFANENVEETAKLIGAYEIVPEAVAKAALPACNITFISGEEMKEKLSGYLSVLYEQNPKAVGGNMPEDDFYYMD